MTRRGWCISTFGPWLRLPTKCDLLWLETNCFNWVRTCRYTAMFWIVDTQNPYISVQLSFKVAAGNGSCCAIIVPDRCFHLSAWLLTKPGSLSASWMIDSLTGQLLSPNPSGPRFEPFVAELLLAPTIWWNRESSRSSSKCSTNMSLSRECPDIPTVRSTSCTSELLLDVPCCVSLRDLCSLSCATSDCLACSSDFACKLAVFAFWLQTWRNSFDCFHSSRHDFMIRLRHSSDVSPGLGVRSASAELQYNV